MTRKRAPKRRRTPRRVRGGAPRRMGIVGKINAGLRGLRLGLPAIGSVMGAGLNEKTPASLIGRYTGYSLEGKKFDIPSVKTAAGFYVGNVVESKVMNAVKIPQMAGKKKILAIAANFLPEITAAPVFIRGDFKGGFDVLGRTAIGYQASVHDSWIENSMVRDDFLKGLGARVGLGLASRFIGPMINKYLPKGVNL